MTETTLRWIERKRSVLFRYYSLIPLGLFALIGCAIFVAAFGYTGLSDHGPAPHNLYVTVPALLAVLAFMFILLNFENYYPRFSVVVRKGTQAPTLMNVSIIVGIIAAAVSIVAQAVRWLSHR